MKKQVVKTICDRCGCEYDDQTGWYTIAYGEDAYGEYDEVIGIRAMFSNAGDGSKYDLCPKCTVEIAKKFVKAMEDEATTDGKE